MRYCPHFTVGKIRAQREQMTFPVAEHSHLWQIWKGSWAISLLEPPFYALSLPRTRSVLMNGKNQTEVPENRHV